MQRITQKQWEAWLACQIRDSDLGRRRQQILEAAAEPIEPLLAEALARMPNPPAPASAHEESPVPMGRGLCA